MLTNDDSHGAHPTRAGNLRIKEAGGYKRRVILIADYVPRVGVKKSIRSNHVSYGKSWASREEITDEDGAEFIRWINTGLARGGGCNILLPRACPSAEMPRRSSLRVQDQLTVVHKCNKEDVSSVVVEQAVIHCVNFLVHNVVHRARYDDTSRIHHVTGKRSRSKGQMVSTSTSSFHRFVSLMKRRQETMAQRRKAVKLTQRKRGSKGYGYRNSFLMGARAAKMEHDLGWLEAQEQRLATVVARQTLHELLPEGAWLRLALEFSVLSSQEVVSLHSLHNQTLCCLR